MFPQTSSPQQKEYLHTSITLLTTDPFSRKPLGELDMNDVTDSVYEEGESIRPSVPPTHALFSVLEQLKDEFRHLQMYPPLFSSS